LKILGPNLKRGDNTASAWHMRFICSGIKYCEYYHPDILNEKNAYNRVDVEHISDLRQKVITALENQTPEERLHRATEA